MIKWEEEKLLIIYGFLEMGKSKKTIKYKRYFLKLSQLFNSHETIKNIYYGFFSYSIIMMIERNKNKNDEKSNERVNT